jgi:hypothetical protein
VAVTAVAACGIQANAATARPVATAKLAAAQQVTPGYTAPTRVLQSGDQGPDVLALQHRLWSLHYWLKITGVFDFDTQEAVYAFQAINGLAMDAQVGPKTGNALVHPHTYTAQNPTVATRIEVNIYPKAEVLVYYKNHALTLISHVSSGGGYYFCDPHGGKCSYAITPTGWYRANWFDPGDVTVPLGAMYNPVFFIGGSYAIHGDTFVPNYPASHGCVRIPDDLATVFHTMISISYSHGTPIHIYSRQSM